MRWAGMSRAGPPGYLGRVSANAEPGVEQPASTLDAAVMRAIAHPARLALLEHLRNSGPATATECAAVIGLSPSATGYHLRALARAGLVEAAPGRGDGRERLWRISAGRYGLSGIADLPPEGREALHALLESLLAWDDVRVRRYLSRLDAELMGSVWISASVAGGWWVARHRPSDPGLALLLLGSLAVT